MTAADPRRPGNLSSELRVATGRLQRVLRRQRGEAALSEGQFSALTALFKHGPMTAGELADHQMVRPPSMTKIVAALCDYGFVTRGSSEHDGRQVVVSVTDAGTREIRETRRRRDQWLTAQLRELDPADRALLADSCTVLFKLMEK